MKAKFLIFFTALMLVFGLSSIKIFAQESEIVSAVVNINKDFLRDKPSLTAKTVIVLVKGNKLKVVPSNVIRGWYLVYLETSPTMIGYVRVNSVKLINLKMNDGSDTIARNKNAQIPPKNIIIDNSPDFDWNKAETQPKSTANKIRKFINISNYCQPPLFCPDIDEVQLALIDNSDKFQKGKFEKTADWEKRKLTILSEIKLRDGRTAADKMYFFYNDEIISSLNEPQYDADKEMWYFDLNFIETNNQTCLPTISQSSSNYFCLISPKKLDTKLKALVSMPPQIAQANEKNLQIVFVGKIIEPFIWFNDNSPIKNIRSGIYFGLEEIICLNPKTGQSWKVNFADVIGL